MAAKRKTARKTVKKSSPKRKTTRRVATRAAEKHMEVEWFTVLGAAAIIILAAYLLLS